MKKRVLALTLIFMLIISVFPICANADTDPFVLEAPKNLTAQLKYDMNDKPYFELNLDVPQSVLTIHNNITNDPEYYEGIVCSPIVIKFDFKYNQHDWNSGESLYFATEMYLDDLINGDVFTYSPYETEDDLGNIKIEEQTYYFRAKFVCAWGNVGDFIDKQTESPYSNVITVGNPAAYFGASDWAKAELDRAQKTGLITQRIKDNMSGKITREEFAEVTVKLYELYTGSTAQPAPTSTFTDTTNAEIFKAYNLGIVNGVGNNKFDPSALITREQMAAMLYRAVKAIKPDADFSVEGAPTFADQKEIAAYFVENVKFMAKNSFIGGMGDNRFAPKENTSREQAVIVALRVYEAYAE